MNDWINVWKKGWMYKGKDEYRNALVNDAKLMNELLDEEWIRMNECINERG